MCDAEPFPSHAVNVTPSKLIPGRKSHRVHDDIEPVPVLSQCLEHSGNLSVTGDVTGHAEVAVELRRHLLDPRLQLFILKCECQLGPFAMHCGRNAVSD